MRYWFTSWSVVTSIPSSMNRISCGIKASTTWRMVGTTLTLSTSYRQLSTHWCRLRWIRINLLVKLWWWLSSSWLLLRLSSSCASFHRSRPSSCSSARSSLTSRHSWYSSQSSCLCSAKFLVYFNLVLIALISQKLINRIMKINEDNYPAASSHDRCTNMTKWMFSASLLTKSISLLACFGESLSGLCGPH